MFSLTVRQSWLCGIAKVLDPPQARADGKVDFDDEDPHTLRFDLGEGYSITCNVARTSDVPTMNDVIEQLDALGINDDDDLVINSFNAPDPNDVKATLILIGESTNQCRQCANVTMIA